MAPATHRLVAPLDDYVVPTPRVTDAMAGALRRTFRTDTTPPDDMLALLRRLGDG